MSATSGIDVSSELASKFADAVTSKTTRFLKISIQNESLVHDISIPVEGSLESDFSNLLNFNVLQDNVPAYVLAKLDDPPSEWLAIYYVPDSAKIRDKMLYASTRASLLKSLGSAVFTDSLFATSKSDLTPEAYMAHKRHLAAPKPLSQREQEVADVRAAESGGAYEGSRVRTNHIGTGVGLHWTEEVETAVKDLGGGNGSVILVIKIDTKTETLVLDFVKEITIDSLGASLPPSEPCYAFFAWPHSHTSPPRREIIFIYSCPSSSPIKHRMVYASGSSSVLQAAKSLLTWPLVHLASHKVETSDPAELDEAYLKAELGFKDTGVADGPKGGETGASNDIDEKKAFAKPRGPGRRK